MISPRMLALLLGLSSAAALIQPAAFARPAVHPYARCLSAAMCSPAPPAASLGKRQRALALLRRPVQVLAEPVRAVGQSKVATRVAGALLLVAASLFLRSSGPVLAAAAAKSAPVAAKAASVDSKAAGKVLSFVLIGGTCAFSVYFSAKDQKEEDERIAAENKRLEQLQSDFQVDKSVYKDEDVMASLRKRMSEKKGDGEGGDSPSDEDKPSGSDGGSTPDRPPAPKGGGSSAVLDPPSDKPGKPSEPSVGSAEDIQRLQRMFNLGNDKDK